MGLPCAVEFRDVWFTYQALDDTQRAWTATATDAELAASTEIEWILRGVSFTVARGETAAIVGHTGAGKTTITALMMRFYDVQRGSVLIDGVDVRELSLDGPAQALWRCAARMRFCSPARCARTSGWVAIGSRMLRSSGLLTKSTSVTSSARCRRASTRPCRSVAPRFPLVKSNSSALRVPWLTALRF